MNPYVYLATGKSRDVSRQAPAGARIVVHYPELGRSVEMYADEYGRFTICVGPDAAHGGEFVQVHHGDVQEEV